ncbi:hypothetical protein BDC45DRAFT_34348 [Circinella umbellata]|nr:hypothetical protein BDC45DRAFT_34348 [Circinella umbellata]
MSISTTTILSGVHWTRTTVLILAIFIVATSLSIYSTHTIPIFSLFSRYRQQQIAATTHHDNRLNAHESTILLEMIQDRRLISTLVAAQASVFCPLFLLLTSYSKQKQEKRQEQEKQQEQDQQQEQEHPRRIALDLVWCHVLMPFGLALSWIFCIAFDRKTMTAILQQQPYINKTWMFLFQDMCLLDQSGSPNQWACLGINVTHGLKYLIVLILILEIELVIAASVLTRYQQRQIQLESHKTDDEWSIASSSFMDEQQRRVLLHNPIHN